MNHDFSAGMFLGALLGAFVSWFVVSSMYELKGMRTGKMIQCVGKSGYHFTCEEPNK